MLFQRLCKLPNCIMVLYKFCIIIIIIIIIIIRDSVIAALCKFSFINIITVWLSV